MESTKENVNRYYEKDFQLVSKTEIETLNWILDFHSFSVWLYLIIFKSKSLDKTEFSLFKYIHTHIY